MRKWLAALEILICLFVFAPQGRSAAAAPRVAPDSLRVIYGTPEEGLWIEVRVEPFSSPSRARLECWLLDPRGEVLYSKWVPVAQTGDSFRFEAASARSGIPPDELHAYRLRYRLTEAESGAVFDEGYRSLHHLIPAYFDLSLTHLTSNSKWNPEFYVTAFHPVLGHPVSGVEVRLRVPQRWEDAIVTGRTDSAGVARLKWDPSRDMSAIRSIRYDLSGFYKGIERRVRGNLWNIPEDRLLLSFDKPLYQPGQMMRVRALLRSPDGRQVKDRSLLLRARDPRGQEIHRSRHLASRWGVISSEFSLPEEAPTGDYMLEVVCIDPQYNCRAAASFRVQPYELPDFQVGVESDKPFYLPGEKAQIKISALYLSGRGLESGEVRVEPLGHFEWNPDSRRYQRKATGRQHQAKLDAQGTAKVRLGLEEHFHALLEQAAWRGSPLVEDVYFMATVRDDFGGRQVQQRFSLRLSRHPVHVFLLPTYPNPGGRFYLQTLKASGEPTACRLLLKGPQIEGSIELHSNRYGFATGRVEAGRADRLSQVTVDADCRQGLRSRMQLEEVDLGTRGEGAFEVDLSRHVYRQGQAFSVTLKSKPAQAPLLISLLLPDRVLETFALDRRQGNAHLQVPYRPELAGPVQVQAYDPLTGQSARDGVWYLPDGTLHLSVQPDHQSASPGARTGVEFHLTDSQGRGRQAALAVSVLDQAILVKAGQDNRENHGFLDRQTNWPHWLPSPVIEALQSLRPADPVPSDLDLAVEAYFALSGIFGARGDGRRSRDPGNYSQIFAQLLRERLTPVDDAVEDNRLLAAAPGRTVDWQDWMAASGQAIHTLRDPWDQPLMAQCSANEGESILALQSIGPDRTPGNDDDFLAGSFRWGYLEPQMKRIEVLVREHLKRNLRPLRDLDELRTVLERGGLGLDQWRSPCGEALSFFLLGHDDRQHLVVVPREAARQFRSDVEKTPQSLRAFALAGASWQYFQPLAERLDALAADFRQASGEVLPHEQAFLRMLRGSGLKNSWLRDYLGQQLLVETQRTGDGMEVRLVSVGPNGKRDAAIGLGDDFVLWRTPVRDFSASWRETILRTLRDHQARQARVPAGAEPVWRLLRSAGLTPRDLRDPWGQPPQVRVQIDPSSSRRVWRLLANGWDTVSGGIASIMLISAGSDGQQGSGDDIPIVHISALVELPLNAAPDEIVDRVESLKGRYLDQQGILHGQVIDESGGVVPGATVTVKGANGKSTVDITSDVGQFALQLPQGLYGAKVELEGFQTARFPDVLVHDSAVIALDVKLQLGGITENVEVTGRGSRPAGQEPQTRTVPAARQEAHLTTRVRRFFPETLFWTPQLITDERGRARVEFPLADSITTWRVATLASTLEGELASAKTEFRTSLPFFAHIDPPPILTRGDRIELPAVLRNYRDQEASLEVGLEASSGLTVDDPRRSLSVGPQQSRQATFWVRAGKVAENAELKLTAASAQVADALQKKLEVRSPGREVKITQSLMAGGTRDLVLELPQDLEQGARGWLTVYPDTIGHLLESQGALLRRPWGCVEQVMSVSWVNLMVLRILRDRRQGPSLRKRAQAFVEEGVQRLLSVQHDNGGFGYFAVSEKPDLVLTASVARFLSEAAEVTPVPREAVERALGQTIRQLEGDQEPSDLRTQAFLAREWAAIQSLKPGSLEDSLLGRPLEALLERLGGQVGRRDIVDPYVLALFLQARAFLDASHPDLPELAGRLVNSARREDDMLRWQLDGRSVFYSWGRTGSFELTASAVNALQALGEPFSTHVRRGMTFLLRNKDHMGSWYSTNATLEVLRTLGTLSSSQPRSGTFTISVNGTQLESLSWSPARDDPSPLRVEISSLLEQGTNRLEVGLPSEWVPQVLVRAVVEGSRPWPKDVPRKVHSNQELKLAVDYGNTQFKLGQESQVEVAVSSVDHGWGRRGMLIAEIGLPPASELDRDWLDDQRYNGVPRYEVHPDRVVCYLWPRGGEEVRFSIRFRPRLRMQAWTTPSRLYDYYNPQAALSLAPTLFRVR
ncbi:MAG TPA: MG2 domain-containing protein [Acidobacteriota bacterium]|nr:MG2 domain-containing protein [Acidobacteriota bacterium]